MTRERIWTGLAAIALLPLFPFLLLAVLLYHNWNNPLKLALSVAGFVCMAFAIFFLSQANVFALIMAALVIVAMLLAFHIALMD